jgi:hypothetical protein
LFTEEGKKYRKKRYFFPSFSVPDGTAMIEEMMQKWYD